MNEKICSSLESNMYEKGDREYGRQRRNILVSELPGNWAASTGIKTHRPI